jgi:MAE_28990/MAE_18760-like HEPN
MSAFADFYMKQIEADLVWRESELAILRKHLLSTTVGSTQETTFLRTNLAMLYAHYEGFCKFALGVYIDALEKLALKRTELKWAIAAQSLGKFHTELKDISNTADYFTKLLNELGLHLDAKASYEKPEAVANLWPDLLMNWLSRLGLESVNVQGEKTRLDSLVSSRNQIAHGKKLTVANRAELEKHVQAATLAMHEVAVGISEALEKKLYTRGASVMTVLPHAVS